ncbi:MAG: hypothetical protein LBF26_01110 [Puniceicoccales bacterium]|jgi:hypothetical protein|nr:hypothetical protein [Puniceicoccales bacterium]
MDVPHVSSVVFGRDSTQEIANEKSSLCKDLYEDLCGEHGVLTALKRRGFWQIGVVLLAGSVCGVVAGVFFGTFAGAFVFLGVGILPHFTPWGVSGTFKEVDRVTKVKMHAVFDNVLARGVLPLQDVWMREYRAEGNADVRSELCGFYKSLLAMFNGAKRRRDVLQQAIRLIDDTKLSSERKVLFIRAVEDFVARESVHAAGAAPEGGATEPG